MGELKNKAVSGVVWSAIERFSIKGVQFVLGLILARLLTPADYGLIAMLTVFMSISYAFIDGGFANALIQCKDRTEKDYSTVFYINLSLSVLFYISLFFAAPYIADFYNQPELESIARVYMLNLIVNSFVSINRVKVTINLNFKIQAKITFRSAVISGLAGVVCAYFGMGPWALVVQAMGNAFLNWILFAWFVRWLPKLEFSKESFHKLFAFGFKIFIAHLISKLYSNLNTIVIGKFYTPASLGVFNRGDRLANFTSSNITAVLKRVAFPVLTRFQDDDKKLLKSYAKYIKLSTFIIFPIMMCLCGMAKPFILTVLTEKWAGSILIMQILSFAYLFHCVTQVNLNLLYVKGRSDLVLRLEIVKKTIAVVILIITLQYGIIAICFGRLLYSLISLFANTYYTKKILDYGLYKQVKEFLPSLIMSLIIAAMGIAISELVTIPWLALLTCLVVCPATYYAMAKVTHNENLAELKEIVKEKKPFARKRT